MQLTTTAQALSAKHRANQSRHFRHVLWLTVLIVLTAVGAWRRDIIPTHRLLPRAADNLSIPFIATSRHLTGDIHE